MGSSKPKNNFIFPSGIPSNAAPLCVSRAPLSRHSRHFLGYETFIHIYTDYDSRHSLHLFGYEISILWKFL